MHLDAKMVNYEVNVHDLRKDFPLVWEMLELLCFIDGNFIHNKIIKDYLNMNQFDATVFEVIINAVKRRGLIEEVYDDRNEYGLQINENTQFKIAQVISKTKHMSYIRELKHKIILSLEKQFPLVNKYEDETWIDASYVIGHVLKMLDNKLQLNEQKLMMNLNEKIGAYYIRKQLEIKKGLDFCNKVLRNVENNEPIDYDKQAKLLSLIGLANYKQGNYDCSVRTFSRALFICINHCNDLLLTADLYNGLAVSKGSLTKNFKKELKYYDKALELYKKVHENDHPDIAKSYNNMACVYSDIGERQKALEFHKIALDMRLKVFKGDHSDTARSYSNIGNAYDDLNDHEKALDYHEKALEMRIRLFKNDHCDIAHSYNDIGCLYENLGDYNNALDYYSKSIEIKLKLLNRDHPDFKLTLDNIHNIKLKIKDLNTSE